MPGIEESKCILVTGATAGIGRSLALALARLPSKPQVIATGRRQDRLNELKTAGLEVFQLELDTDMASLKNSVDSILDKYPQLDAIILSAGVQYEFYFDREIDVAKFQNEMNVNYTSVTAFITYLLPHFWKLSDAGRPSFIVPITAGIGIVPGSWVPGYSASKAALHSFTLSLRVQLKAKESKINVLEIIPPFIPDAGTTEKISKFWMPLDTYTEHVVEGLKRGESTITTKGSLALYEKYETGKEEDARQFLANRQQW